MEATAAATSTSTLTSTSSAATTKRKTVEVVHLVKSARRRVVKESKIVENYRKNCSSVKKDDNVDVDSCYGSSCSSPSSSSSDHVETSCCSSNGGSGELEEHGENKFVDLADEDDDQSNDRVESRTYNPPEARRDMTPSSELQRQPTTAAAEPRRGSSSTAVEKMPTEFELEEFFMAAEKNIESGFSKKYNYDIVKDAPLEGRYEWVPLKP